LAEVIPEKSNYKLAELVSTNLSKANKAKHSADGYDLYAFRGHVKMHALKLQAHSKRTDKVFLFTAAFNPDKINIEGVCDFLEDLIKEAFADADNVPVWISGGKASCYKAFGPVVMRHLDMVNGQQDGASTEWIKIDEVTSGRTVSSSVYRDKLGPEELEDAAVVLMRKAKELEKKQRIKMLKKGAVVVGVVALACVIPPAIILL
jgi:hypothetical protein